jgi:DNA-binding NarL/FixJ family response regulator
MSVWDALINPGAVTVPEPVKKRAVAERGERKKREFANPWGLKDCEVRTIEALCEAGCAKSAAKLLNLSPKTVEQHSWRIRVKMKAENTLLAALIWDRYVRAVQ